MKLKTRIILGFTMIILMPLLLFAATLYGFSQSQAQKTQVQTEGDGTVYDIHNRFSRQPGQSPCDG